MAYVSTYLSIYLSIMYIYIYIYLCVCMCVCVSGQSAILHTTEIRTQVRHAMIRPDLRWIARI